MSGWTIDSVSNAKHRLVKGLRIVATIDGTVNEAGAIAEALDMAHWMVNGDPRQSRTEMLKNLKTRAAKIVRSLP